MKFEIKHKLTGAILFAIETDSWRLAIEGALKAKADLSYANLSYADLSYADLSSANLRSANLSYANLSSANLSSANLSSANLSSANLRSANLSSANLSSANLSYANLSYANLSYANLSQSKNLLVASQWLRQFKTDKLGIIVYRSQPGNVEVKPKDWVFKPKHFLTEVVNPNRQDECGCGVNFSTLEWAKEHYGAPYWKCRIRWEDLPDVVVPYNTDGKARCGRLELVKIVK